MTMDRSTIADQPVELREYLEVLRRRKITVLLVTGLLIALGLAQSFRQTPVYEAESRLLIKPLPSNPYPNVDTESEVVASLPVAALVRDEVGLAQSPDSLLDGLTVTSTVDTEVATISYQSPEPEIAQRVANSFAQSYIDYRRDQEQKSIRSARESIEQRIGAVREDLRDVATDITKAETGGQESLVTTLETERSALIARLGLLEQQLDDVSPDSPSSVESGEVLELAALPTSPASPDHSKNGVLAGIIGLVLGVGTAFVRERLDDRFRGRDDVEAVLNAPVLATVQRYQQLRGSHPLVLLAEPEGSSSEAYRSLRTTLKFVSAQRGVESILITSPSQGEGKTVTTANLGIALAQAGSRVIMVSADLRRPTLESYFGIPNRLGLTSWLLGEEPYWQPLLLEVPDLPNIRVLPSGPVPANPAELLDSPLFAKLVRELEQNSDMVLLDSAPTLPVADPSIIATRVGGVVVVLDAGSTPRSAGAHAHEQLVRVGANLLGTVLNRFDPSSPLYSSYYSSQNYYGRRRTGRSGSEQEASPASESRPWWRLPG